MILQNIENPIAYHVFNFKSNNIITYNHLKLKLQQIREVKFPNDNKFLKDISTIKNSFDNNNNINLQNLLCVLKQQLLLIQKKIIV